MLSEALTLSPEVTPQACVAWVMAMLEFTRVALTTQFTRSPLAHALLTLVALPLPAGFLAVVLVYGAHAHPERSWLNLGFGLWGYLAWYVAGESTRLVRRDSDGAELGFMFFGALATFPVGVLAALLA